MEGLAENDSLGGRPNPGEASPAPRVGCRAVERLSLSPSADTAPHRFVQAPVPLMLRSQRSASLLQPTARTH